MLDANTEIERLRYRLKFKNLNEKLIDEICDEVSRDIQMMTSDILAEAMIEAVDAGAQASSVDFIDELKAVRSGRSVDIITESGKTDFSEPPFPMLPRLLKNAKVAKDGSLYKVVPIRQKSGETKRNMAVTTEAAYRAIEVARRAAKAEREEQDGRAYTSPNAMKGMDTFSAMQAISKSRQKQPKLRQTTDNEPVINFRTASSKQDASTQWRHPGRPVNMGPALNDINDRLHDAIDRAIEEVIRMHEGMY